MAPPMLRIAVLAVLVLPTVMGATGLPAPLPAGEHVSLDAVAFDVLRTRLSQDGFILPAPGQVEATRVADQMMGVLAHVRAAEREPARAEALEADALALWRLSRSYNHQDDYFYIDLRTSNDCIDLVTNGWALAAALDMARLFDDEANDAKIRIDEIGLSLSAALETGSTGAVSVCDDAYTQHAEALLAMLALATDGERDEAERAVRVDLGGLLNTAFEGGAFHGEGGVYDVTANAKLLSVLTRASAQLGDSRFLTARDELAVFLRDNAVRSEGGHMMARSTTVAAPNEPFGEPSPEAQLWLTFALDEYARTVVPGFAGAERDALLEGLFERFWDASRGGGLLAVDGALRAGPTAAAAILMRSPTFERGSIDRSEVSLLVRARATQTYPAATSATASEWLLANTVEQRFTVSGDGDLALYYPASAFGTYDLSLPQTAFYPAATLVRTADGTSVPLTLDGDDKRFLRFDKQAGPATVQYTLNTYLPVVPVGYEYDRTIDVHLRNPLDVDVTVPRLALALDATQVAFGAVTAANSGTLAYQTVTVPANLALEKPHTRLTVTNLVLRPGDNTIRISYEDLVEPTVAAFRLYEDRALTRELPRDDGQGPYRVRTNEVVWAGIQAADNTLVKQVNLEVRRGGEPATNLVLEGVPGRDGWFRTQFRIGAAGTATLTALPQDTSNNLGPSATVATDVRSSFLAGASIILFVFAAGLFLLTVFIYAKIHRRHRP